MPPTRRTKSNIIHAPASSSLHQQQASRSAQGHEQVETQGTAVSVASLPPKFQVFAAFLPDEELGREEEACRRWREAEELLSDGWRRDTDVEGRLADLRERKRRKIELCDAREEAGSHATVEQSDKDKLEILWYTAAVAFPCSCKQPTWPYRFKPRHAPPVAKRLHPLPPHPSPLLTPRVGSQLEEWAVTSSEELDPALNDLEDYEYGWQSADGLWGRGWDFESPDTRKPISSSNNARYSASEEVVLPREKGRWKGKGKAIEPLPDIDNSVSVDNVPDEDIRRKLQGQTTLVVTILSDVIGADEVSWQEEAKRRKALWRQVIKGNEGGYGRMWDIVPLPHTWPALLPDQSKHSPIVLSPLPGAFVLPRALSSPEVMHPYHPDLPRYIRKNPLGRVYWLIPVHGPVLVPSFHEHGHGAGNGTNHVPVPSAARLLDTLTDVPLHDKKSKERTLIWTPPLLRHFLDAFLLPLYRDPTQPLGAIHISISGPKPDPWIDLRAPSPLSAHLSVSSKSATPKGDEAHLPPARAEAGDHIRIYCDARYALPLRTWLYGIEYDPSRLATTKGEGEVKKESRDPRMPDGPSPTQSSTQLGRKVKLFQKIRLALIGSRQEVLTVA